MKEINWKSPLIPNAKIHSNSSSLAVKFWISQQNILFPKKTPKTAEKSNQWTTNDAERIKCKKLYICNQRRDREEKLCYMKSIFPQDEKNPISDHSTLLPLILIIRAGNITRKCEEPEAAEAFFKKLEIELHCKLDFNKMNSQNLKKYLKITTQ